MDVLVTIEYSCTRVSLVLGTGVAIIQAYTVGVKKTLRFRPVPFYCPFHPVPFRSVFLPVFPVFLAVPSVSARLIQGALGKGLGWAGIDSPGCIHVYTQDLRLNRIQRAQALGLEGKTGETGGTERAKRAKRHTIFLPVHYQ